MTRPEALFPLFADLETLEGVGPKTAQAFGALGVTKPYVYYYFHSKQDVYETLSWRPAVAPACPAAPSAPAHRARPSLPDSKHRHPAPPAATTHVAAGRHRVA